VTRPAVLSAGEAALGLKRGFDQMAELLALTLGPMQGNILSEREDGSAEILADSATIARRILELPGQASNVGAMLMRNIAWRVHLQAGDGVATTAVLAQSIFNESLRYTQAGGNPMVLKRGVDRAAQVVRAELAAQTQPVIDEDELTLVAETITAEPALSLVLGEMLEILGPAAHITIEDYVAPYLERAYFDGGRWKARLQSPYFITDNAGRRAIQNDCLVILFAGDLKTTADVQPLLELLVKQKKQRLLLVTHDVSGEALGTLVLNHQRDTIKSVVVSLRRPANRRADDLADLALLTGATVIDADLGRSLAGLKPADLGHVRRAEASPDNLIISGGGGHMPVRREFIEQLQTRLARLPQTDEEYDEVRLRLARLSGGVGVLKIGAQTKAERTAMHQKAEKAVRSLRLAMAEGVVPGGGIAYLGTIPALEDLASTLDGDEQYGVRILERALEAPFRRIVQNRGVTDPATALARVRRLGRDYAYDVMTDRVRPYSEAGLFDPAGVLRIALETAVSGAMLALTTGAIVLHRKPKESFEP
jgi:chaperonin GroEL